MSEIAAVAGAEGTHQMARRRKYLRIAALAALLLVASVVPFWTSVRPGGTAPIAIPTPSKSAWESPSPVPPTPAVSPTSAALPVTPGQATVAEKPPAKPGCTSYGFAGGDTRGGPSVLFTGGGRWGSKIYKLCPGESVRVWWVQYRWQPDGSQKLWGSGSGTVSYDKPSVTLSWPDFHHNCLSYFALGTGTASFPATIAAGARPDPLIRTWREGQGGSTTHGFLNRTEPANC